MSTCKDCGAPIVMRPNARGYYLPINVLGGTHRCQRKSDHIAGKSIVGARYTPSCGECDVPPWERCACSFPEVRA